MEMISRLKSAREWASRIFVSLVIVAAVSKDHVFSALILEPENKVGAPRKPEDGKPSGNAPVHYFQAAATEGQASIPISVVYTLSLILMYAVLEVAADFAIDNSKTVRNVLMGHDNIEGYWLDIVFLSDKIIGGGLVYIYYYDGKYKAEGRDFDESGIWRGWFASELSSFDDRSLSYKYRALRPGPIEDGTGHGEYNFASGGRHSLTHFYGFFYEDRNPRRFYTYGERVSVFVDHSELNTAMQSINIPPLVTNFIKTRGAAVPVNLADDNNK